MVPSSRGLRAAGGYCRRDSCRLRLLRCWRRDRRVALALGDVDPYSRSGLGGRHRVVRGDLPVDTLGKLVASPRGPSGLRR